MDPAALTPHGLALLAYFEGDSDARLVIRRDDGVETPLPARHFFRAPAEFTDVERAALDLCEGRVLDVGAGTGLHALELQSRGLAVTALDIDRHAAEIMARRGVRDVRRADIFSFEGGPFDTLLMLGHGIGMVGDVRGLDSFLARARRLTHDSGQLLVHSLDVRRTDDPGHLAYHEANRRAGRYIGEIRIRFEYEGRSGPYCGWLHVDRETLGGHAERAGWACEIVLEHDSGDYLARLTRRPGA